ncbi:MAG: PilT/PilU family type 4a pilus ATPase [Planctomycetes bacterium]|nr:PilT/PilU family type 4a pilus ATPase [Planctomycetota bacterium]
MTQDQPIMGQLHSDKEPQINKYFHLVIKIDASDLHMKVNMVPRIRIRGALKNTNATVMTEARMEELIFEILTEEQKKYFLRNGALDFAWQVGRADRFRVNVFRQRGLISLAARHITSNIPPFEMLHLPTTVEKIAEVHDGLVLVTGPTGCGKSSTIASMIDHINSNRSCHIVTIEDPIEFLHVDKKAIVSQREIGVDVPTYEAALRSLMRRDPDVVLVGEIRDNETLTAAMRAAETGHMVFGTLHSVNASQTIQRILDLFPQEERELARQTFALTIRAIISQQLLPGIREDAKIVPAIEILLANPIVRKLISEGRENDLPNVIRSCQKEGMQDITESLRKLIAEEWVDLKVGLNHAPNVEELKMALKGIRGSSSGIL